MVVHDWHKPDDEITSCPKIHANVEPLYRVEADGVLHLRCVNKNGEVLSMAFSAAETDRLAEFLWTERK